jgi:small GTP-binding protein
VTGIGTIQEDDEFEFMVRIHCFQKKLAGQRLNFVLFMNAVDQTPKYKVVFVGDSTVGKTSIIHSYLRQDVHPLSTLGATSTRIEARVDSGTVVLNVWDTAGQESLRNLVPVYAKGSQAAIIVFDQTNPNSFEHVKGWYNYITEHVGSILMCLAANKSDLPSEVDFNEVFIWAAEHKVEVVRTSATKGINVDILFETISRELERQNKEKKTESTDPLPPPVKLEPVRPSPNDNQVKTGGDCCK